MSLQDYLINENKKKVFITKYHMNYLLDNIRMNLDSEFKCIAFNDNTSIRIYSHWHMLVADFYYDSESDSDKKIIVVLSGNWNSSFKQVLRTSILKTFSWKDITDKNWNWCCDWCCFPYLSCFSNKNKKQLKFICQ